MPVENRRVVLAVSEASAQKALRGEIQRANLDVVGCAANGSDALKIISQTAPDVLIVDAVLPLLDGFELIRMLDGLTLHSMPVVVLLSNAGFGPFNDAALKTGVYRVFEKPVEAEAVVEAIVKSGLNERMRRANVSTERINELLWSLGFSAKVSGTQYLNTAIQMAVQDIRLMKKLTKELYPIVAVRHGVTGKIVERCMRGAIESAWSAGALNAQHALFGNTIDARRGKPTCGEMIARIADLLRAKE